MGADLLRIERCMVLPSEILIRMIENADFRQALEFAYKLQKPSVIDAVRKRIFVVKFGHPSVNINLAKAFLYQSYIKQFRELSQLDYLDVITDKVVKVQYFQHAVTFHFLEVLYFSTVSLLAELRLRRFVEPQSELQKTRIIAAIDRCKLLDYNIRVLFRRTVQYYLRPPSLFRNDFDFYGSRNHGFAFAKYEYPKYIINTETGSFSSLT